MNKILAIFRKDTLVRFTSPMEWAFFLILPIVFTFLLGGGTGQSSDNRVPFYVVDRAASPLSASLLENTPPNRLADFMSRRSRSDIITDGLIFQRL